MIVTPFNRSTETHLIGSMHSSSTAQFIPSLNLLYDFNIAKQKVYLDIRESLANRKIMQLHTAICTELLCKRLAIASKVVCRRTNFTGCLT
jgi:hypothetical protein